MRIWRVVLLAGIALAQSPAWAQDSSKSFDAVSVKKAVSTERIDLNFLPGRLVATNVTLNLLVQQAYGLQANELEGGPDWSRADRFDVTATTGSGASADSMREMLRALLADRFKLDIAATTRRGTVYALVAMEPKGLSAPRDPAALPLMQTVRNDTNGFLSFTYAGKNATLGALAARLAQQLRAPVTDQTAIAGPHDFKTDWAYDSAFGGLEPDPNVPTIFTALRRDLGLELRASQGDVAVHVIRSATRPTPD